LLKIQEDRLAARFCPDQLGEIRALSQSPSLDGRARKGGMGR